MKHTSQERTAKSYRVLPTATPNHSFIPVHNQIYRSQISETTQSKQIITALGIPYLYITHKPAIRQPSNSKNPTEKEKILKNQQHSAFIQALQDSSETQHDTLMQDELVSAEQLWVDKYSPDLFTELLSDEHTNREVLCISGNIFLKHLH